MRYYFKRKSDNAEITLDLAYKLNPIILSEEYTLEREESKLPHTSARLPRGCG